MDVTAMAWFLICAIIYLSDKQYRKMKIYFSQEG